MVRSHLRRWAALALALCIALTLTACWGGEKDVTALVQGNIDEIYLGKFDEDYLKLVGISQEEAQQAYLDGLEVEAEFFANYWAISDTSITYDQLDEGLRQDIVDLYKEIYSHTKFEVKPAVKQSDGSYTVQVLVDPIDIMQLATDVYDSGSYQPLEDFWAKYGQVDLSAMSEEEYLALSNEYGALVVQLVEEQLDNLGYLDQKSLSLQIQDNGSGVVTINQDDWGTFDDYVIYYPGI